MGIKKKSRSDICGKTSSLRGFNYCLLSSFFWKAGICFFPAETCVISWSFPFFPSLSLFLLCCVYCLVRICQRVTSYFRKTLHSLCHRECNDRGGGGVCTVCVERCKRKIRRETNCSLCGNILRKIHNHDWFLIDSFLTSGGRESSTRCENGS